MAIAIISNQNFSPARPRRAECLGALFGRALGRTDSTPVSSIRQNERESPHPFIPSSSSLGIHDEHQKTIACIIRRSALWLSFTETYHSDSQPTPSSTLFPANLLNDPLTTTPSIRCQKSVPQTTSASSTSPPRPPLRVNHLTVSPLHCLSATCFTFWRSSIRE